MMKIDSIDDFDHKANGYATHRCFSQSLPSRQVEMVSESVIGGGNRAPAGMSAIPPNRLSAYISGWRVYKRRDSLNFGRRWAISSSGLLIGQAPITAIRRRTLNSARLTRTAEID